MVDSPTADNPREPDISHENPARKSEWFGHPSQLARLFTTEMWERFGYYGMRALLTLYLTKHFLFGDREATGLYGGFTALVYLTPLVGGLLARRSSTGSTRPLPMKCAHTRLTMEWLKYQLSGRISHSAKNARRSRGESSASVGPPSGLAGTGRPSRG